MMNIGTLSWYAARTPVKVLTDPQPVDTMQTPRLLVKCAYPFAA